MTAASVGTLNTYVTASAHPPVDWPVRVGVVPRSADCFQERAEVAAVERALAATGTAVLCQVLTGMGGVGKTQLAARYARRAVEAGAVDVRVWVTAVNRQAVVDAYAQAAAVILQADPSDAERAAQRFLSWLEPSPAPRPVRWLIVLDDLADPKDLAGLWPPDNPSGRTVVTTRSRDAALTGSRRRLVPVGLFTQAEATAYLTASLAAHDRTEPPRELALLADDLGLLPLALSQAAAYLVDAGLSAADYRRLLADRARTLADHQPATLPDDQPFGVHAAWQLSIDRANALDPAGHAHRLLHLASMLDPNGIPQAVLTSEPACAHIGGRQDEALSTIRLLHRLSLVDHAPGVAVRVHQLIQRTVREARTPEDLVAAARACADALVAVWPEVERDTLLAQSLRANATALAACSGGALFQPDAHVLLYRAGKSLGESGQVGAARDYFRELADATADVLGADHLDTLSARGHLAWWLEETGDYAATAAALTELLNDRLRVLGPDHPSVLTTRHNLAHVRGAAGDHAGAATALAELLDDRFRLLGSDHPDTLSVRHNLAYLRGSAGDAAGAAAALAELLDDRLRIQGPDHPSTLTARHGLASWLGSSGDTAGAVTAHTELLADRIRVLGPDHPDTLATRRHLARWRGRSGDTAGALAVRTELLADLVRVLGPDHPHTLTTRQDFADLQGESGDTAGAVTAHTELLADLLRVLGTDHPLTINTSTALARWQAAGTAAPE